MQKLFFSVIQLQSAKHANLLEEQTKKIANWRYLKELIVSERDTEQYFHLHLVTSHKKKDTWTAK